MKSLVFYLLILLVLASSTFAYTPYEENKVFSGSTFNYNYFSLRDKVFAFSKEGDLLWSMSSGTYLNDIKSVSDTNGDNYEDLLIALDSYSIPSLKLVSGKNGDILQSFPILKKTYKNNHPLSTTKIINSNGRIIFSSFNGLYEFNGGSISQVVEVQDFILDFDVLGSNIVIITPRKMISYDLNFKELKKRDILGSEQLTTMFSNSYFLIGKNMYQGGSLVYENKLYDSNLNLIGEFSSTRRPYALSDSYVYLFDDNQKAILINNFYGQEYGRVDEVTNVRAKSKMLFFTKDKWLQKFTDNNAANVLDLKKIVQNEAENVELIGDSLLIKYSLGSNEIKIYKGGVLKLSVDSSDTRLMKNIDGSDLIINKQSPFSYSYNEYSGSLSYSKLESSNLYEVVDLGDLNNDGINEPLLIFKNGDYGAIQALAVLFLRSGQLQKISFIPSESEISQAIQDLTKQIDNLNNTFKLNENKIESIRSQVNSLNQDLNNANQTERQRVQNKINRANAEIEELLKKNSNLNVEIFKLVNEKEFWKSPDISQQTSIESFAKLNKKLIISLLSNKLYSVDLNNFNKEEIKLKEGVYPYYIKNLENAADINNDGSEDLLFVHQEKMGVISGVNYNLIWNRGLNNTMIQSHHKLGSKIVFVANDKLKKYRLIDGSLSSEEQFSGITFSTKLDNMFLYTSQPDLLAVTEDNNYRLNMGSGYIDPKNVLSYDCNNDRIKEMVMVGTSSYDSSLNIYCINFENSELIATKELIPSSYNFQWQQDYGQKNTIDVNIVYPVKEMDNYLMINLENNNNQYGGLPFLGNVLVDTTDYKIKFISPYSFYSSNGKVYAKNGVELLNEEKGVRSESYNGNFDLRFNDNRFRLIYVDNVFTTASTDSQETLKLMAGEHDLAILTPSQEASFSSVEYVHVLVQRERSAMAYVILIIILAVLIVGTIVKWKRMKQ